MQTGIPDVEIFEDTILSKNSADLPNRFDFAMPAQLPPFAFKKWIPLPKSVKPNLETGVFCRHTVQQVKSFLAYAVIIIFTALFIKLSLHAGNLKLDLRMKKKKILNSQIIKKYDKYGRSTSEFFWILKDGSTVQVDSIHYNFYRIGYLGIFHIAPKSGLLLYLEEYKG